MTNIREIKTYSSIEDFMGYTHHAVVCQRNERPILALCGFVGAEDDAESRAMARLFSAAPDMLRALEKAIVAVRQGPAPVVGFERNGQRQKDFNFGWNSAKEQVWSELNDALIALAKAKTK